MWSPWRTRSRARMRPPRSASPVCPGRVAPAVSSCNCMASCEAKWTMPGPAKRTGSGRTRDRRSSPFVQRTESDASDAADRASKARKWISSDHEKRYFGASRIPRLRVSGTRAVCIAASDTEVVAWRRQRLPDVLALHQWPGRRTRPPDSPSLCGSPADDDASRPRSAREHATYFHTAIESPIANVREFRSAVYGRYNRHPRAFLPSRPEISIVSGQTSVRSSSLWRRHEPEYPHCRTPAATGYEHRW